MVERAMVAAVRATQHVHSGPRAVSLAAATLAEANLLPLERKGEIDCHLFQCENATSLVMKHAFADRRNLFLEVFPFVDLQPLASSSSPPSIEARTVAEDVKDGGSGAVLVSVEETIVACQRC